MTEKGWGRIFTVTPRGNQKAWLVIEDDEGQGEPVALLKVSKEEFWERFGNALNIKFVFPDSK